MYVLTGTCTLVPKVYSRATMLDPIDQRVYKYIQYNILPHKHEDPEICDHFLYSSSTHNPDDDKRNICSYIGAMLYYASCGLE